MALDPFAAELLKEFRTQGAQRDASSKRLEDLTTENNKMLGELLTIHKEDIQMKRDAQKAHADLEANRSKTKMETLNSVAGFVFSSRGVVWAGGILTAIAAAAAKLYGFFGHKDVPH